VSDVLSDVLRAVRLTGAVFFSVEGATDWAAESPPAIVMAPFIRPGVEHVMQFHAVTSGSCWGGLIDEPPVQLQAGDILLLPQGDRHMMSSRPGMSGDPVQVDLDPSSRHALPLPVRLGRGDETTVHLVCGFLGCDARPFNPLLSTLPRKLLVREGRDGGPAILTRFVELALSECRSSNPGRECALARLSELMFVEAVRRFVATLPEGKTGWLAGLADELSGRALRALHEKPSKAWTIEDLAREIGTSRSVLAERFTQVVGVPPMQYLAEWRMQLAAELLSASNLGLAEIAPRVGYGSEAALSRAFKRMVGVTPALWREGDRAASLAPPGLESASPASE
jgi:AraC-like DNA-binding protein